MVPHHRRLVCGAGILHRAPLPGSAVVRSSTPMLSSRARTESNATPRSEYDARGYCRQSHHCGRRNHDLRLRQFRALRPARAEAHRFRTRVRGVHRRNCRAVGARPRDDGAPR